MTFGKDIWLLAAGDWRLADWQTGDWQTGNWQTGPDGSGATGRLAYLKNYVCHILLRIGIK